MVILTTLPGSGLGTDWSHAQVTPGCFQSAGDMAAGSFGQHVWPGSTYAGGAGFVS